MLVKVARVVSWVPDYSVYGNFRPNLFLIDPHSFFDLHIIQSFKFALGLNSFTLSMDQRMVQSQAPAGISGLSLSLYLVNGMRFTLLV